MANTTSQRPAAATASAPASTVNPANAAARAANRPLSAGNGCQRRTRPHGSRSVRTSRPDHPSATAWSRYHGRLVMISTRWPLAVHCSQMVVTTSPVGAVSGT